MAGRIHITHNSPGISTGELGRLKGTHQDQVLRLFILYIVSGLTVVSDEKIMFILFELPSWGNRIVLPAGSLIYFISLIIMWFAYIIHSRILYKIFWSSALAALTAVDLWLLPYAPFAPFYAIATWVSLLIVVPYISMFLLLRLRNFEPADDVESILID